MSDRKTSSLEKVSTKDVSGLLTGYLKDKEIASVKLSCRALNEALKANEKEVSYWRKKYQDVSHLRKLYEDISSRRIITIVYIVEDEYSIRRTRYLDPQVDILTQVQKILDDLEVHDLLREEIDAGLDIEWALYHRSVNVGPVRHDLDIALLPPVEDILKVEFHEEDEDE